MGDYGDNFGGWGDRGARGGGFGESWSEPRSNWDRRGGGGGYGAGGGAYDGGGGSLGGGWGEPRNNRRPGDWDCPNCHAVVFGSKNTCFKCGYSRDANADGYGMMANGRDASGSPGGYNDRYEHRESRPRTRPGDWTCGNCGALVFASKSACFKCHTPREFGIQVESFTGGNEGGYRSSYRSGYREQGGTGGGYREPGGFGGGGGYREAGGFGGGGGYREYGSYGGGGDRDYGFERRGPPPRPGDWTCPECHANVFASKTECYRCHAPRPVGMNDSSQFGDGGRDRY